MSKPIIHQDTKLGWLKAMQQHPLMIAGPCSAETEEQVLTIAHQLKDTTTTVFRAGIWKPRTRPGSFEGVGAVGLKWLQRAREETGLKIAVEVANKAHVEQALLADIDVLWIGARSTVSPFIVQEIADAMNGTDKIVLVKNPVNPDVSLWMGAVERLQKANIKNLGVIHRGFSTYLKSKYRNNPEWQLAIDFQNHFPHLPLILDPSHMGGRRDLIFDLSQTGLDLNYDGLMIETHTDPDNAWSDAAQQITPATLKQLFKKLQVRSIDADAADFKIKIKNLRKQIDTIDSQILSNLGSRMKIADEIGRLKNENNVAILQMERWNEVLERMKTASKNQNLSEEFITELFKAIHQESIEHQHTIIKNKP
ncbi:bifunctional 3-deoxy-7-phosphoheptulonate synthase/chorismate mutase type II [uncultured Planktosalinus sp.]|uniref:bifunctional 3-deoxy-7-phosphoheptulonate synthase/chorismate mutase type II n=1 Tax=uncultured Planktosalinus sp. TaxID=1810935 RepID=UPI0030D73B75